jgi:hypothetical protein
MVWKMLTRLWDVDLGCDRLGFVFDVQDAVLRQASNTAGKPVVSVVPPSVSICFQQENGCACSIRA